MEMSLGLWLFGGILILFVIKGLAFYFYTKKKAQSRVDGESTD